MVRTSPADSLTYTATSSSLGLADFGEVRTGTYADEYSADGGSTWLTTGQPDTEWNGEKVVGTCTISVSGIDSSPQTFAFANLTNTVTNTAVPSPLIRPRIQLTDTAGDRLVLFNSVTTTGFNVFRSQAGSDATTTVSVGIIITEQE
jgi:hypothetical protein